MTCLPDSSGANWFQCALGTVGCPRVHDLVTPHCIACAAGGPCPWGHDPPAVARTMTQEEYLQLVRGTYQRSEEHGW